MKQVPTEYLIHFKAAALYTFDTDYDIQSSGKMGMFRYRKKNKRSVGSTSISIEFNSGYTEDFITGGLGI
jgi:hypothetical protein